jgi:hypothetical protein
MTRIRAGRRFLAGARPFHILCNVQPFLGPPSSYLVGVRDSNLGTIADHSSQVSVEVRNTWGSTSTAVSLIVVVL